MLDSLSLERETKRTLSRLMPRLQTVLAPQIASDPDSWGAFLQRLRTHFPSLFHLYFNLYGDQYDFLFHLEDLLTSVGRAWFARPSDLRELDLTREAQPLWFQSNQMLGGVCYVNLFANNLSGLRSKIPYLKELGLTYLHLMPLFKMPAAENDGGYAISNYREVYPPLGTIRQLASLARDLRSNGISLVLDFVFNHTSDEHIWARLAQSGDPDFVDFYRIFPDRSMPNAYESSMREIFPEEHSGAFSFKTEVNGWVWTTFHGYQWDLNYANPAVFNRMAEEMLFLANEGVEVLRLDAVAFIWKELGTSSENLPQAHNLIRAFNTVARMAAPALLFKSEAIVHPDEVTKYISPQECQLSYNPLLMALLWNSLATRKVHLLSQALSTRSQIDPRCAWVNYVRSHDDIGWTFSDEDVALLGVKGNDHRHFLNDFYLGKFPGSFARGLPFQQNPKTDDCRITGTCASLAGLEKAINEEGPHEVESAIRRILLIHGIVMTVGGLPLIYLGDETGTFNDYSFRDDPAKSRDTRWVNRPRTQWKRYANRKKTTTVEGRVYRGFQQLVALRKQHQVFSGGELQIIQTSNEHVLGYVRRYEGARAIIFANFSEAEQTVPARVLEQYDLSPDQIVFGNSQPMPKGDLTLAPLDLTVLCL